VMLNNVHLLVWFGSRAAFLLRSLGHAPVYGPKLSAER
jgi:hypothetical protein